MVIDGHSDRVSGRPRRIVARRDLNLEGHGPRPLVAREPSTDIGEQGGALSPSGCRVAKGHAGKSLSQRSHLFHSVQLLEALLRFEPKWGSFSMLATALFGEPHETTPAVDRRWMDRDQTIPFQEAEHLSHRGTLDIEPFGERVHRDTLGFAQRRQGEELRNAQARWFEMSVIESRDLPSSLPRSKTIALIDPERLIDR